MLQRNAAIREYATALSSPVINARYGAKKEHHELTMLAANVGRHSNKAADTTIKLCYGALDVGVPVEVVLRAPEKLASLIRARAGITASTRSRADLHEIETRLQGDIDRIQVAMLTGRATTQDLIEARERIAEMQKVLAELDADLEREINDKTVGTGDDK